MKSPRQTIAEIDYQLAMHDQAHPLHVRIHRQCGACGVLFATWDRLVARIELTIDSNGIECIKRLAASDKASSTRQSQFTVYPTARADQNLTVNFQFGLGRLESIHESSGQLQILDVPRLPESTWTRFPGYLFPGYISPTLGCDRDDRLATVDLSVCFGMTFFIVHGNLSAIHAHTRAARSAEATFATIHPQHHGRISQAQDQYTFRSPFRGDFAMGRHDMSRGYKTLSAATPRPSTLVYTFGMYLPYGVCSQTRAKTPSSRSFPRRCRCQAILS
ncbi:hypothetical protein CMUS01_10351 [Colletotrichum musicola]|uniref:Uncharacterized protein n=1 Tax=Colletotrichum musicola TaxID=2175873 RepID=A0A8H6N8E7_9PEZI|nr:hypothetical protein CMUS01_10351 [Colletotrichum musicola]